LLKTAVPITQWQSAGGLALAIAATALDPSGVPAVDAWAGATRVDDDISAVPSSLSFTGSAVALIGTIGE